MSKLFAAFMAGAALSLATVSVVSAENAPAPAVAAKFSADTPIESIVANPDAKAVLDKVVPGVSSHPQYEAFKGLSLRQLAPYSEGKITDDVIKAVDTALANVKG